MRKIIMLWVLGVLFSTSIFAMEVDFSKAFVVPEKSTVNKLILSGFDTSGKAYSINYTLQDDFSLIITDSVIQDDYNEKLEQALRNTIWKGVYSVGGEELKTVLMLKVVQDGYVAGEIKHSAEAKGTSSTKKSDAYLHARVAGDIITQYKIDGVFLDEDRIEEKALSTITKNTAHRQLIRVQRMRALKYKNDTERSKWGASKEYRLVLEDDILSGMVEKPVDLYGSSDKAAKNGTIALVQQ